MVIGQERSPLAIRARQAEQLRIQRVRQLTPVVARDRPRRGVERGAQLADEMLPGAVVTGAAGARERQVGDVEGRQVDVEIGRRGRRRKAVRDARAQDVAERLRRDTPADRAARAVQPRDRPVVDANVSSVPRC